MFCAEYKMTAVYFYNSYLSPVLHTSRQLITIECNSLPSIAKKAICLEQRLPLQVSSIKTAFDLTKNIRSSAFNFLTILRLTGFYVAGPKALPLIWKFWK